MKAFIMTTCLTASAQATAPQGPSMSALIPSRVATSCSALGHLEGVLYRQSLISYVYNSVALSLAVQESSLDARLLNEQSGDRNYWDWHN